MRPGRDVWPKSSPALTGLVDGACPIQYRAGDPSPGNLEVMLGSASQALHAVGQRMSAYIGCPSGGVVVRRQAHRMWPLVKASSWMAVAVTVVTGES